MKDGERGRPIENYGKKEQKEWLDNTLHDPHSCTAGNKEEEHTGFGDRRLVVIRSGVFPRAKKRIVFHLSFRGYFC